MWIGELITERGIGNGISFIIFAGIVSRAPGALNAFRLNPNITPGHRLRRSSPSPRSRVIIYIQEGQRRIPIQYASRVRGRRMYSGGQTFLPLRVNQAGVIPIIFAVSILLFPHQLATYFSTSNIPIVSGSPTFIVTIFTTTSPFYIVTYFLLTMGFTYFYTAFTFKPDETAEQLRKNGGFIPGIRPGRPTQDYLARVVTRITFAGALFLAIVAVSPSVVAPGVPTWRARIGRHEPPDRRVGRGRDDEADRSPADDAQLRRLHPVIAVHGGVLASSQVAPLTVRSMTVVVLLGAPGAGKGTQAPALARGSVSRSLAPGDLLRQAVADGTPLGREADRYMSRGQLVPDDTIVRVFLDRLEAPDAVNGAILDGFPRTKVQAEALDAALAEAGRRVDRAGYIDVPLEDLVKRMANRRICTANGHVYNLVSNPPAVDGVCDIDGSALVQRADDAEETVRARMAQQVPPLLEVVEHYRDQGVLPRSTAGWGSTRSPRR